MPFEVKMPKLGLTMVEGKIVEWKKKEGENVRKGEILLVIETEKISYDYDSPESGIIGRIVVQEGQTALVGATLAYILGSGETLDSIPEKAITNVKEIDVIADGLSSLNAQSSSGGVTLREDKKKAKISPLAKKLAEDRGLDITRVKGTGPEGRIVKEDILNFIDETGNKAVVSATKPKEIHHEQSKLIPLTSMRQVIARRMAHSFQTAPHSWTHAKVNATNLKSTRDFLIQSVQSVTGQRLTYTDLMIKIVAKALEDHPAVNCRWTDNGIEMLADINIGIAVSIPNGLIVPVICNANAKSIAEITRTRADLVLRAKAGKLTLDEISGGTFTITNLGTVAGIISLNPIINSPEAAILGVGALMEEPVVEAGQIVVQLCLTLTLGIDHRVLDGFIAAQFLSRIKELMEQPLLLL